MLAATPQAPEWEPSYGKALAETRTGNSPLLVVLEKPNSEEGRVDAKLLSENKVSGKEYELLRPYRLCRVDVTTQYGKKVARAFRANTFPHVAIIDKTGSLVLYRKSGKMDSAEWQATLARHKNGERPKARPVTHVTYSPVEPAIYSSPFPASSCPNCQRQSF
jgi:hypothetical protein